MKQKAKPGDYCLFMPWPDGDPQDPWAIGYVHSFQLGRYLFADEHGNQVVRSIKFRVAIPITQDQGRMFIRRRSDIEKSELTLFDWLDIDPYGDLPGGSFDGQA